MKVREILTELGPQMGPRSVMWQEYLKATMADKRDPSEYTEQEVENIWLRVRHRYGPQEADKMQAWADAEASNMLKPKRRR